MEDLQRLFVEDGWQEMPLPLKRDMNNYYVFLKVDLVCSQPCILWEMPMDGHTLDTQLRTFSEIHGFLNHLFSHQFWYGGGDLLDKSGRWNSSHCLRFPAPLNKDYLLELFFPGFVSEVQHNMIMAHASSRTFIKHYWPQQHTGLQEVMCGLNPDEEFLRAVTWMSCWINQQWPWYLNDADQALVERDLELQSAVWWWADLKTQCEDCAGDPALQDMLDNQEYKVSNLHCCLQDRQWKEAQHEFSWKQAVIDIERQLTGSAISDQPAHKVLWKEFTMPPEQILLVEMFFTWPTTDSLEDEWEQCNKAVAAGIQYCSFWEGGPLWGQPKHSALSDDEDQVPSSKTQKENSSWGAANCVMGEGTWLYQKAYPECRETSHMLSMLQGIFWLQWGEEAFQDITFDGL